MKRILPFLIFLLWPTAAFAQVATVTGHVLFPSAGPPTNASVCFSLQNFKPNVPRIISTGTVVQQQNWCISPSTVDGTFSTPVARNDFIDPTGTFWRVDYLWNGVQQSSATFLINHTPFNLDTEIPLNKVPIAGPNQIITQSFICSNFSAVSTWTCTHNFNDANVEVSAYTIGGVRIFPDTLTETSPNVVTLTWVVPQSGVAVIVHGGAIAIATNQPNAVLQNPTGAQSICCQPLTLLSSTTFTTNGLGTHNGINNFTAAMNALGGGSLIGTFAGPTTLGAVTVTAGLTANNVTDSALTAGNCVQAGTAGLLTTAAAPCSSGGGGGGTVTSFAYAETGLDSLLSNLVTNSTTTPLLTQTAAPVPAGTFFAGPIPSGSATNPTFENSAVNAGSGTFVSLTAAPAAATTVVIYLGTTSDGQPVAAPAGFSDFPAAVPGVNSTPHYKNLSSTASITPSSTITNATWSASVEFLGGSITSIPQNVSFSTCGNGCASGTLGAVTAGHTIVVFGYYPSVSGVIPDDVRATDSVGNGYVLASFAPNSNINGHYVFVAQNVASGTPTITVRTSKALGIGNVIAFEVVGPGPYYTGPNGSWAPRHITAADLSNAGIQTVQTFSSTTLGSDVGVPATTQTTVASLTVKPPAVGCPCRAFINYSLHVNTGSSGVGYEFAVSDGTNVMAGVSAGQSNGSSGALISASYGGFSPFIYGSGTSVTFTLLTKGDHTYTVKAVPPTAQGLAPNSSFQVSFVTSN